MSGPSADPARQKQASASIDEALGAIRMVLESQRDRAQAELRSEREAWREERESMGQQALQAQACLQARIGHLESALADAMAQLQRLHADSVAAQRAKLVPTGAPVTTAGGVPEPRSEQRAAAAAALSVEAADAGGGAAPSHAAEEEHLPSEHEAAQEQPQLQSLGLPAPPRRPSMGHQLTACAAQGPTLLQPTAAAAAAAPAAASSAALAAPSPGAGAGPATWPGAMHATAGSAGADCLVPFGPAHAAASSDALGLQGTAGAVPMELEEQLTLHMSEEEELSEEQQVSEEEQQVPEQEQQVSEGEQQVIEKERQMPEEEQPGLPRGIKVEDLAIRQPLGPAGLAGEGVTEGIGPEEEGGTGARGSARGGARGGGPSASAAPQAAVDAKRARYLAKLQKVAAKEKLPAAVAEETLKFCAGGQWAQSDSRGISASAAAKEICQGGWRDEEVCGFFLYLRVASHINAARWEQLCDENPGLQEKVRAAYTALGGVFKPVRGRASKRREEHSQQQQGLERAQAQSSQRARSPAARQAQSPHRARPPAARRARSSQRARSPAARQAQSSQRARHARSPAPQQAPQAQSPRQAQQSPAPRPKPRQAESPQRAQQARSPAPRPAQRPAQRQAGPAQQQEPQQARARQRVQQVPLQAQQAHLPPEAQQAQPQLQAQQAQSQPQAQQQHQRQAQTLRQALQTHASSSSSSSSSERPRPARQQVPRAGPRIAKQTARRGGLKMSAHRASEPVQKPAPKLDDSSDDVPLSKRRQASCWTPSALGRHGRLSDESMK